MNDECDFENDAVDPYDGDDLETLGQNESWEDAQAEMREDEPQPDDCEEDDPRGDWEDEPAADGGW